MSQEFARALTAAEQALRATGLTGAVAFEALRDTLLARLEGEPGHPALHALEIPSADLDMLGLAYERFFPDLFKGRVGQFFTPRVLGELLLSRLPVGPGTQVLDPTAGSGGLLVLAGRAGADVRGMDIDPRMAELCGLNLRLAGLDGTVERADFFRATPKPVDVVVANPPFSVPIRDPEVLSSFALGEGRERALSDVLFMEALERWVKPGGHAGIVVPWTLIANERAASVREWVDSAWRKRAILCLPEGVFRPFGGAAGRAALLWLQRRPCEDGFVAWGELADPGYDVRSTALKPTSCQEVGEWIAGKRWRLCSGWLPQIEQGAAPPLKSWVRVLRKTRSVHGLETVVDLADTDKRTGEPRPRVARVRGRRAVFHGGHVLVSRMRPELGNVTWIPEGLEAVGSTEWIVLESDHPAYAFHALRSQAWRDQLPPTTGQTRPRTDAETVMNTRVPLPSKPVLDRLAAISTATLMQRRRLEQRLGAVQSAVDRFLSGELDEAALDCELSGLED